NNREEKLNNDLYLYLVDHILDGSERQIIRKMIIQHITKLKDIHMAYKDKMIEEKKEENKYEKDLAFAKQFSSYSEKNIWNQGIIETKSTTHKPHLKSEQLFEIIYPFLDIPSIWKYISKSDEKKIERWLQETTNNALKNID